MVGPGRGSGAGSIVAYCLDITHAGSASSTTCSFERFLNPERVSMPDIDMDFCYERRQEVIDYVARKYGAGSCVRRSLPSAPWRPAASMRDVGRVLGYAYAEVDQIAKLVPMELDMTLEKALDAKHRAEGRVRERSAQVKRADRYCA